MSPTKRRAGKLRNGGRAVIPTVKNQGLSVLQLNVEGLTTAKLEVLRHLADSNGVAVLLLQETHCTSDNLLKIPGFDLTGSINSKQHGVATFVRTEISWAASSQSPPGSNIEWLVTKIQETSVVNVYKPPPSELSATSLPSVTAPAIYAGDFNCQHTDWGYNHTTPNGVALNDWASNTDALLLYDPKEPSTFFSARWNTTTNPDLAFAICRSNDAKPERRVLDRFPRSQHRPSIIKVPSLVESVPGKPVKRWNFRKANWESYTEETERRSAGLPDPESSDVDEAYGAYCRVLLCAAKKSIPRGYNRNYIPGWDEECSRLLSEHQRVSSREEVDVTAAALIERLDATRKARWTEVVESIDFTHSSRKAWRTINQLTGRNTTAHSCPVTANAIASQLLKNGRFPDADKDFARLTSCEVSCISRATSVDSNLSGVYTTEELSEAMSKLKPGKSPGRDNIHPEFVIHQSTKTSRWLCAFFTACYQRLKLPKIWRRASVIALPKPNKDPEDPKSYRPISLLSVPFKILERMIHSRIEPVVDSQLPREQAGFRRGRSTADQVTLLSQDIENSFHDNEKAGVVYLDLTAAYDTVWHRGLHLKLLRTIPDRHMVKFIMETLSNRSFILQTSSGQCSRLRRLRNGVPQGSVLSPMLFNIYIHDLPDTSSTKYGYADDLAIMLSQPTWKAMEDGLNEDMDTMVAYLRRWRLQLSVGKTVAAAYHLSTREAKRELKVSVDGKLLEVQQAPKYLGVRLDRTLSFSQHLQELKAKVTSRVALIRRLAGTTWGASAKTLRISTQALVFSAAEYCAPVWSRSPHARKVDVAINNALRIITGCLKPTPVFLLPVLAGIAPAGLRREAATLVLARKAQQHDCDYCERAVGIQGRLEDSQERLDDRRKVCIGSGRLVTLPTSPPKGHP
ncbi:putative RNA-directed DNA polymerase from transposon X-element [Diretmus argenteus]